MRHAVAAVAAAAVAVAALLAAASVSAAPTQHVVDMKVLVLGTKDSDDPVWAGIKSGLEGVGIPYEIVNAVTVYAANPGSTLDLTYTDGNGAMRGRYYAVVLESRELGYEVAQGTWGSALTTAQWTQLETYLATYTARSLSLYSWPWFAGVVPADGALPKAHLEFDSAFAALDNAYNANSRVDTVHSWVTPADVSASVTVEAVATFHGSGTVGDNSDVGATAAAVETLPTGAERLHFFFVLTVWHPSQLSAMHLAVQWLTRGVYLGERRVHLGLQIDDLFLATPEWTPATADQDDGVPGDRIEADDMAALAAFQAQISADASVNAPGSQIIFEWALNGEGIEEAGGVAADPLAQQAITNKDDFFFVHHTYTHPNLDDMTYEACKKEIDDNTDMVAQLWGDNPPSTWGPSDLVPPSISGLFNGDCLRGLQAAGVYTEVGDNSRPELLPETYGFSPYHGLWTTNEVNGQPNTFIIPRYATNVFYNNGIKQNNLDHFNAVTGLGWTWEQLMQYEADLVARNVLAFRHDPYMFHQLNALTDAANGAGYPSGHASLLQLWTQAVVAEIQKWTRFPIVTWQQRDMRARLLARMARDECGIDARMVVQDGIAVEVLLEASGICEVALTGLPSDAAPQFDSETYNGETTLYVAVSPGQGAVIVPTGSSPPPPTCSPACDAEHGTCDTSADPPACTCDLGWGGATCASPVTAWGANFIYNPTFYDILPGSSPPAFTMWNTFVTAPTVASDVFHTGVRSARLTAADDTFVGGMYQYVPLGQATQANVRVSGWSRATGVSGIKDGNYAVYVDTVYNDGTWQYGTVAAFDAGTHGWQYSETILEPTKPIAAMWVYCMFRYHSGTVEFDDISVQIQVPTADEDRPTTTDGRCGFNSPLNAQCSAGNCCSDYGWCGPCENPDGPQQFTYEDCEPTACWGDSTGPCMAANTVCFPLDEELNECPAGTTACNAIPCIDDGDASVLEVELLLDGISEPALDDALQGTLEEVVGGESGASATDTGGADVTDVTPTDNADASTGGGRRRRMSSVTIEPMHAPGATASGSLAMTHPAHGRALQASVSQCSALAATNAVTVRMTIAAPAGGPSASEMAANVQASAANGDLDARLEESGLGVHASVSGIRVQEGTACGASTIDIAVIVGSCVAALAVGGFGGCCLVQNGCIRVGSDDVEAVDPKTVGKSSSIQKLQLPRIRSGHGSGARRGSASRRSSHRGGGSAEYSGVGTQQGEDGELLAASVKGGRTDVALDFAEDAPLGTPTPRS